MLIKALTSFSGIVTMMPGEKREVPDRTAQGLIRAGFAEAVENAPTSTGYVVGTMAAGETAKESVDESESISAGRPEAADVDQAPAPPKRPPRKRTAKAKQ